MSKLSTKTCCICAVDFMGGNTAKYCPNCRAERIRQRDRERHQRKLAGKIRHIGSTDLCVLCSNPYVVKGGSQKHCPECAQKEAMRRSHEKYIRYCADPIKITQLIARSRAWAIANKDRAAEILRASYRRNKDKFNDNRRKRLGVKLRPLGRVDVCKTCHKNYIVKERNQRHCDVCRNKIPPPELT